MLQTTTYKETPTFFGVDYTKKSAARKVRINYSTFGAIMPNRTFSSGSYRFGFNGKEKDDEINGSSGSSYDYGLRMYDARLGRFLSVDPLTKNFPWFTPYQFAGNTPIMAIDLEGAETFQKIYVKVDEQGTTFLTKSDGNRIMEVTNGHDWSGTKSVYTYFVYKKGSKDYVYYDSKNPGDAEAKMRADGVKFSTPKLTKQILNAPAPPIKEWEAAKKTIKNYFAATSLVVGGGVMAAEGLSTQGVLGAISDADQLTGASDKLLEDNPEGKVITDLVKVGVDIWTLKSDFSDLTKLSTAQSPDAVVPSMIIGSGNTAGDVDDCANDCQIPQQ